jgi:hypothetical protein
MKALSIKQPWAWLICAGYKDIENRNWKLPQAMYCERIYVHAGKTQEPLNEQLIDYLVKRGISVASTLLLTTVTRGAIIGEVDIKYCVESSKSPWFAGKYGFVLANPELYKEPLPCRGQLGFFEPDIDFTKVRL